jgi:hypothetical protein
MPTLDLIGPIELTASAAILVGGLAAIQPEPVARLRVGAWLGGWFALVVIAAAFQLFDPDIGLGAPAMGFAVLAPVVALAYAARRSPAVNAAVLAAPVPLLIGIHAVRVLGLSFVLLYAENRLPAPFAPVAGWGDVFIGLTALPVAWLVSRQAPGWRAAALGWNALGLLDLVAAIGLGITSAEGSPVRVFFTDPSTAIMSSLPWVLVPAFLVPLLMAIQLAVFHRLASSQSRSRAAGGFART